MNLLGIGPFELLLILVIATIVLGPERMDQTGRTLGRLYGEYRSRWQRDVDEMTSELRRELEMLQQEVEEIRQSTEEEIKAATGAVEDVLDTQINLDVPDGGDEAPPSPAEPAEESSTRAEPYDQGKQTAPSEVKRDETDEVGS
jgi:sec-independent protein translocase protein TatB